MKTLDAFAGSADTAIAEPLQVPMTRKQARAFEAGFTTPTLAG
jgi:hypothetical protein